MQNDVRLIDANALMEQVSKKTIKVAQLRYTEGFNEAIMKVRSMIHSAPTIDAVPVVHARWEYRSYLGFRIKNLTANGEVVCSNCHSSHFRVVGTWFKFCPNCGAKMDGGASDGRSD